MGYSDFIVFLNLAFFLPFLLGFVMLALFSFVKHIV